ncbi:hypothetical protein AB835_08650 [Candidatus Endobugula sertula]|uniref:NAD-dependent epimerase/dehydratase domain-containing protein n=1 Tax=Candidatus Endobugula sertula TaxID=62101 RepID=A0A1D2QPP5_9GAMM|nr:hypothetical protein AB835_08650 [Candidatus Endobugula sertula]
MYRKILVTGGAGFIGRATVEKLLSVGYEITSFDLAEQIERHRSFFDKMKENKNFSLVQGSILDKNIVRDAVENADVVIHLAAMLGVKKTEDQKLGCMEINITGTENILNASVAHGVKKFLFASSSEVYGEPNNNPIKETDDTKGKTVYAVSKLAGEELTKGYHQRYPSLDYTIVRFFNTYGEGQVAQFVLTKFVNNVLQGKNPIVYGNGQQERSYGHVDDVTDGLKLIIENSISNGNVYNLGNSTQVMTLKALGEKVIETLAPDKGLTVDVLGGFDGADRCPEREIHTRYCDTSLAKKHLNYEPTISVVEGIHRIAAQEIIHVDWPNV